MSYDAVVYQVLIASPSDVTEEREAISKAIHSWNADNSLALKIVLLPIKWETHSTPGLFERPQAMLNKQLVEPSDILVGIFWTRIGTGTGASESGTIEEIDEFKKANKPILTYFSQKPIPHDADLIQLEKVRKFKTKIMNNQLGLIDSFSSTSELEDKLDRHLTDITRGLKLRNAPDSSNWNDMTVHNQSYHSAKGFFDSTIVFPATLNLKEQATGTNGKYGTPSFCSTNPQLDEQILERINHAIKTDNQRLALLAFLHPTTAKPIGDDLEMESEEIKKIANILAQENQLPQMEKISGTLSGFRQVGELKNLEILCKRRRVNRGSIWYLNVKWLPYLHRIQQDLKWHCNWNET